MPNPTPPLIRDITNIRLPSPARGTLSNGIPIYDIRMGTEDVLKIELVFHGGRPFEHKKLVSRITGQMLKEGTKSFDGKTIAESIDYFGASLSVQVNLDYTVVVLYTLKKHFGQLLPILTELVTVPTFPEQEFHNFIKRNKQKLLVDLSKNDVQAYRMITENIFGADHFYGYNSSPELYDALTISDVQNYFSDFFGSNYCQVFVSGKTDDAILENLNDSIGQLLLPKPEIKMHEVPVQPVPFSVQKPGEDSLQTAIRIGCRLFNRNHPDYNGLFVLNTILGGYFGSRLMMRIREKKGYTYNIYSMIDPMRFDGLFYIATEVGTGFVKPALKAIYKEMDKLTQATVTDEEILMVRRYLLGNILTMIDGPFNVSEVIRTLIAEDTPLTHFDELVDTIRSITPDQVQLLAQKYLQRENMFEVVLG